MRSLDGGRHWSERELIPAGIIGPTKNKPVLSLAGDSWVYPSSAEVGEPTDLFKAAACWIEHSDLSAHIWTATGPLTIPERPFGVIEPALFRDPGGHLHMLCRDRAAKLGQEGWIWTSSSEDDGQHWSPLSPTNLPNPDSGFDAVELSRGALLLVYHHSHTSRSQLHWALSSDGGAHWQAPQLLMNHAEAPAVILGSDGLVHLILSAHAASPLLPPDECKEICSNSPVLNMLYHIEIDPAQIRSASE